VVQLPASHTLRPAAEADRPFLLRLYASTRADEVARTGWPLAEQEAFLRMQFEAQHHHYHAHCPDAEFAIVTCGGEDIGRWYVHRTPVELRVMDVALLPAWRQRGIGAALFAGLIAESERCGLPIGLFVEHENPARQWYARLGFGPVEMAGPYLRMQRPAREPAHA
jgi:ribosomal protein S18 acetylase RimI-like enzyme